MTTTSEREIAWRRRVSRCGFLKADAGTAALPGAVRTHFPSGADAEGRGPEVSKAQPMSGEE